MAELSAFNRTIFGIETLCHLSIQISSSALLIAPFLELKLLCKTRSLRGRKLLIAPFLELKRI